MNDVQLNALKYTTIYQAGPPLERVRRVHPHPLKLGNGCAAPVLRSNEVITLSKNLDF